MTDNELELVMQRCLHGELAETDQQTLFAELDQLPDGWRRLALAFVDEQSWGQACRELVRPPEAVVTPRKAADEVARSASARSFRWTAVAGLLVALGVGYGAGQLSGRRPSEGTPLAGSARPSEPVAVREERPMQGTATILAGTEARPSATRRRTPVMTVSSGSPAPYMLDLPLTDLGEDVQSVQIPVYPPSSLNGQSRPQIQRVLSEDQQRELERLGYRLNRERKLITVPLETGETILVPVDTYGARYGMQ